MKKILFFLSVIFCISSCRTPDQYITYGGYTQGTTWQVKFKGQPDITQADIENILLQADTNFSIYSDTSLITKINKDIPYRTNPCFDTLFRLSEKEWKLTGGYFDITVGPLVKHWGFGPNSNQGIDSLKVDSLLKLCGMEKLKLSDGIIIKASEGMFIDVNAIAQGYTVDMVAAFFEENEIENYLVEIGGEVRAKGINAKGTSWQVGIDKPTKGSDEENRELQEIISVSGFSVATSGSYRKFIMKDGIMYSHTIDPHTGFPSHHNLLSVTIKAPTCADADAIATAVMAMGMDRGKDFLERNKQYEAYFIYSDSAGNYSIWMTPGFEKLITKKLE